MTIGEYLTAMTANWRSFVVLALLVVVAYRMGRRGLWMIVPFAVLVGGLGLWYGSYGQTFDPHGLAHEIAMPRLIYGWVFTFPILGMLILLATLGPKRNTDIQGSVA